jgi:hypothetical protein
MKKMIHMILCLRWFLSSFIICFYIIFTFYSTFIDENGSLFSFSQIVSNLKSFAYDVVICMIILCVISWDLTENAFTLEQKGAVCICIGFDLVPTTISGEIPVPSEVEPTTIIEDNPR